MTPALRADVLDADATDFDISLVATPAAEETVIAVRVVYRGEQETDAAIRVTAEIADATDPWWMIPGLFYGENRPAANDRLYPRFEPGARDAAAHAQFRSDQWHFRSDRAAAPVVFCWPGGGQRGWALSAAPDTFVGLTGFGFALRDQADPPHAELSVTFPAREYPVTYYGDASPRDPLVTSHHFKPGATVELIVTLHELSSDRHDYARVLRTLHARLSARAPLRPWMDVTAAAALAAEGLLRWHYDPDPGVLLETVGFDREITGHDGQPVDRQAMHVGWVSGIPWAYAMLRHAVRTGDAPLREAATRVIDFCTAERSPSGTLWGVWYRSSGWTQSWTRHHRGLHSRTLGEATQFLARAATLVGRDDWAATAREGLEIVAARQRPDGNLGSIHHAETGEVLSWDGSSGLAWVAALADAGDADLLEVAERAGAYYARFVYDEYLHGAPEDVDLAVTSEDGYVALMAYVALYRATGAARWLDLARRSAEFALTFRYVYDVRFAAGTMLSAYDFGTRGADQASASNQHLHAYGLVCTRELIELADATGDAHYRARAEETLACFRQFVARFDGDFNAYRGMVTERYYQTECFQPKGMLLTLSHAWSAGVLLLACEDAIAAAAA
ncbi:beta-L-arabinofuranosidase domain-containing protein [Microbacterium terrisoli]|uniref:beta-L-arabinofuranosidase domain-containing protein n=1 Tax=Microbacterium terrisoli TaxID=3242192 RepID=UPI002803AFCF|nr:beta-L-arabinofuranosidase domain-containing protein [Microbacterium protaetiae]